MPIALSRNDFITKYYAEACTIADKTIGWVVKQYGPIPKSIDVELVKDNGVLDGLEKTYKNYDPERESGASIKTFLNKVVRNSVLTELGKEKTRARRDGRIAPPPKKPKPEGEHEHPELGQGFIPGISLRQSKDGRPSEAHGYMENIGWRERKDDLCRIAHKCLKWLPDHDRIIILWYLEDKSTYVERSLEELGMENTRSNANWVYQRRDKALKAITKFFKKEKPDYRDISIEPYVDSNRLHISDKDSITLQIQPQRIKASREDHYDYRKVATQLVDFYLSSLYAETTQSAASRPLELFLPGDELSRLEEQNIIEKESSQKGTSDSFGGLNRSLSWLARCDCAILSGWRKENTRKVNDENNKTILNSLREKGYGLCRCRGYYPESGNTIDVENSFFTFDRNHSGKDFFESVRSLAEMFNQDSFLFIEAEGGKRFLYGTNDYFGKGKREYLGALHIGAMESECFTKFGNKKMVFRKDDDS